MTTLKSKLGVAVVGLGVGEKHAQAYLRSEHCQIKWLFDLDQRKSYDLCRRLGCGKVPRSYEEILEDPDTHIVSVASFDQCHFDQVIAAQKKNKHLFVEKPLCRSLNELKQIHQIWASNKGKYKIASNLILRAAPVYQWLRQKVENGFFGDIYAFDGDYLYGRLHKITEGWRKDVPDYSVMMGGGIHLVDLMIWLLDQRPTSISTVGNKISSRNSNFQYEDFMCATLKFSSGLIVRLSANFGCMHKHQHVLRLFGTKGTFIQDDCGPRYTDTRNPEKNFHQLEIPSLSSEKGNLIPYFIDAIVNDLNLDQQTQSIFDGISICVASDQSIRKGTIQNIEYL